MDLMDQQHMEIVSNKNQWKDVEVINHNKNLHLQGHMI